MMVWAQVWTPLACRRWMRAARLGVPWGMVTGSAGASARFQPPPDSAGSVQSAFVARSACCSQYSWVLLGQSTLVPVSGCVMHCAHRWEHGACRFTAPSHRRSLSLDRLLAGRLQAKALHSSLTLLKLLAGQETGSRPAALHSVQRTLLLHCRLAGARGCAGVHRVHAQPLQLVLSSPVRSIPQA